MDEHILSSDEGEINENFENETKSTTVMGAIKEMLPACVVTYLFFAFERIGLLANVYFMSKTGDPLIIAAMGFGNTWMMLFPAGLSFSFSTGIATLVSQAHGAGKPKLCAYTLHKGLIMMLFILLLFFVSLLFFKPSLAALDYDQELLDSTLIYTVWMIPSQVGSVLFTLLRTYAQGLQIFNAPVWIQAVFTVIELIISYILVYVMDCGFAGLGFSRGISELGRAVVCYFYLKKTEEAADKLIWFDEESFKGFWSQMKYQFTTGMVTYVDMITALTGEMIIAALGVIEFDAAFAFISILIMLVNIPLSVIQPAGSYIGNAIGQRSIRKTQLYIKASHMIVGSTSIVLTILLPIFSSPLSGIFLDDPIIKEKTRALLIAYSIFLVFDVGQLYLPVINRSLGEEEASFKIMIFTDLVLGMFLQVLGGIVLDGGALGTWIGVLFAFTLNFFLQWRLLSKIDLRAAIRKVHENLEAGEEKTELEGVELKALSKP